MTGEKSEKMGAVKAIRTFFESKDGRKVTLTELNALTHEDRQELGAAAARELGVEYEPAPEPKSKG